MLRITGCVLTVCLLAPCYLFAQESATAGSEITLKEARQMTRGFSGTQGGVRSYFFSKHPFLELLAQPNTHGIRFWYGRKDQSLALVAIGTDALGQDHRQGVVVDDGETCPPECPGELGPSRQDSRAGSAQRAPGRKPSQAGAVITLEKAEALTQGFTNSYDGVRSHLYSADLFRKLLTQEGAEGLRIYPGWKDGKPHLIFLATDAYGEDLRDLILDDGIICPPNCPAF